MDRRKDDERINEIHDAVILLVEKCKKIDAIDSAINGNGQDGLKTRMRVTETSLGRLWKFVWIPTAAAIVAGIKSWWQ